MKIETEPLSADQLGCFKADIETACGPGRPGRVCGACCTVACPQCGSTLCSCMCNRSCANAPRMLSSEPDAFPIEAAIAPLVFELRKTGCFTPCWSCEGHNSHDGSLHKTPELWFRCPSAVHLRILADMLATLHIKRRLGTAWSVSVSHSDPGDPSTTFVLRPCTAGCTGTALSSLQSDAMIIADAVSTDFATSARRLGASVAPVASC